MVIHVGQPGAVCDDQESTTDYGSPVWTTVSGSGGVFDRAMVRTPWLRPDDDLVGALRCAVGDVIRDGDTIFVSEKVAVLLTARSVPASTVRVGPLARLIARGVKPVGNSRGLSIPEKVQYVVDHAGAARVLAAAVAAAATRPFGFHGAFYVVAGSLARDLDGMRPPYDGLLLPPLSTADGARLAAHLQQALGVGVAIVDINDRGGSVRATSPRALPAGTMLDVLKDNPLGQRDQSTPVGLVRPRRGRSGVSPALGTL